MLRTLKGMMNKSVDTLLDLYAGVGTFSFGLRDKARRVLSIESSSSAVLDFQANCILNETTHLQIRSADVREVLPYIKDKPNVTVLDPPRSGCPKSVIRWVGEHTSEAILYVSCDPATLARDLAHLDELGWQVDTVQPVDLFPQTFHIETLVKLTRK